MQIQRILIAEDDPLLSRFIESHLKRGGRFVTTAASLAEARTAINQGTYDLIISDIRFPDGDGVEFLRQLRKDNNTVMHITMTGYGSITSAVESMRLGTSDYLIKPFTTEQLDIALERLETWHKLASENAYLRKEADSVNGPRQLLGDSEAMKKVKALIDRVAPTDATVLIQGESGTGKELVAHAIWAASTRKDAAFIKFNCAAVPENLMESELFGHEKGAFTGAVNRREGRFQLADGGTLLLDEVSEIPIGLQSKLLRVLQESEFERVGSSKTQKINIRIIATSNRNLKQAIEKGEFREDLFYRLNVFPLPIPALRERREDIKLILDHYLQSYSRQQGKENPVLTPECLEQLQQVPWKGNVRELQNAAARAIILWEPGRPLQLEDFGIISASPTPLTAAPAAPAASAATAVKPPAPSDPLSLMPLDQMERHMIELALVQTQNNKTAAAKILGISVRTLRNKLQEYGAADIGDPDEPADPA